MTILTCGNCEEKTMHPKFGCMCGDYYPRCDGWISIEGNEATVTEDKTSEATMFFILDSVGFATIVHEATGTTLYTETHFAKAALSLNNLLNDEDQANGS